VKGLSLASFKEKRVEIIFERLLYPSPIKTNPSYNKMLEMKWKEENNLIMDGSNFYNYDW
jgi:hypothetical protein